MAARVCVLASSLVTGILTARALGPSGRGQYFTVTTAGAIIAQLSNLGLTSSNVFLGASDRTRIRSLLANSVTLTGLLALLGSGVVTTWGASIGTAIGVPESMLWAICLIGAAMLLWSLATSLLVAEERFTALNTWQVVNALVAVLAIIACATVHGSAVAFAFASAIAAALTAVGASLSVSRKSSGAMRFSPELVRLGIGFSTRAYLSLLLSYLLQRSGASLLVASRSPAEVGQYSVASQVADVLLIVPGSIGLVLYPYLVRRNEDLWPHVRRTAIMTTATMVLLSLIAALTAPVILPLVFGAGFAASAAALWGLLPSVIAYSIVAVLSQYLVTRAFSWTIVAAWAAGFAVALVCGIPLTRSYGAVGAGVSQSCGAALVCALVLGIVWRRTRGLRGGLRQ